MSGGREGHTNLSGSAPWVLSAAKRTQPGTPSNDPTQRATRNWNNGSQPNGITLPFLATRLRPAAPSTQGQAGTPPMCRPRARLRGPLGKTPLSPPEQPAPLTMLGASAAAAHHLRRPHQSPVSWTERTKGTEGPWRAQNVTMQGPSGSQPPAPGLPALALRLCVLPHGEPWVPQLQHGPWPAKAQNKEEWGQLLCQASLPSRG